MNVDDQNLVLDVQPYLFDYKFDYNYNLIIIRPHLGLFFLFLARDEQKVGPQLGISPILAKSF